MKATYKNWLERLEPKLAAGTVHAQINRAEKVEQCYGDLDEHFDRDRLRAVVADLQYSAQDGRLNKPNPSKIPINGDTRSMLAAYRHSTERYCKFRRELMRDGEAESPVDERNEAGDSTETRGQLIGLERDLQAALRGAIGQLEDGLEVDDGGAERSVASGFIDITAKDARGSIVVIELKTGTARRNDIAQVLSYMGDVSEEEPGEDVRGVLVAGDFDRKAKAAARVVPSLSLRAYSVRFEFLTVGTST